MGSRGLARAAVVVEVSKQNEPRKHQPPPASPPLADPGRFYAAALLKVARELRQPEPRPLEEMLDRILAETPVDREAFRGYLQRNFSLLGKS